MQVYLDDQGYVNSYVILGTLTNGIEVNELRDLKHFQEHFQSYKVVEGNLIFDENKESEVEHEALKTELRDRRAVECFALINRSPLWYDSLTSVQHKELKEWYEAWLAVTDTMTVPEKPEWLH